LKRKKRASNCTVLGGHSPSALNNRRKTIKKPTFQHERERGRTEKGAMRESLVPFHVKMGWVLRCPYRRGETQKSRLQRKGKRTGWVHGTDSEETEEKSNQSKTLDNEEISTQ